MCGIIGIVAAKDGAPPLDLSTRLVAGLKKLEYRGYDSAGIAVHGQQGIEVVRVAGKIKNLENRLKSKTLSGTIGIGHTRWATHGIVSQDNAHPITTRRVTLVHNGIIENYAELRTELGDIPIKTQTDTEIIAHLFDRQLDQGGEGSDTFAALKTVAARLQGAFALAIMFHDEPDRIAFIRQGSPLMLGYSPDKPGMMMVASDVSPFVGNVTHFSYLQDGSFGFLDTQQQAPEVFASDARPQEVPYTQIGSVDTGSSLGNYRHFLEKEIYEQPDVIAANIARVWNPHTQSFVLPQGQPIDPTTIKEAVLTACGSAYYACCVGEYFLERFARIPSRLDVASELRTRDFVWPEPSTSVLIGISQSGETMDTLEALLLGRRNGQRLIAIINNPHSAIAREAGWFLDSIAGFERSVATTKAFTAQVLLMLVLALTWGSQRGVLMDSELAQIGQELAGLSRQLQGVLELRPRFAQASAFIARHSGMIYLGRGVLFPIALEGALKLKELSYMTAEAYPAGELKHGPLATVEPGLPVVLLAPSGVVLPKLVTAAQQVLSRGADLLILTDPSGAQAFAAGLGSEIDTIVLPEVSPALTPLVYSVAVQLLAYEIALIRNPEDIDQPRNLAKSVTVE